MRRGIPEHRLQDVAREFNYSETTFVYPPSDQAHTRRVRIFTPGTELPFAGHPTVGTAHVLAAIGDDPAHRRPHAHRVRGAGRPGAGDDPRRAAASDVLPLSVAKLPEEGPTPPPREALAARARPRAGRAPRRRLGASRVDVRRALSVRPVRDRAAVARSRDERRAWERALAGTWAPEIFIFARDGERAGSDLHGRMFAPAFGIAEDPATGSAAAAMAGYLARRDPRRDGTLRWRLEQGFEMERPSILDIEADVGARRDHGRARRRRDGARVRGHDAH